MKRENPPCTPYKRKAKGKEIKPVVVMAGLSRVARVRAHVSAAVEDALVVFHGSRGPGKSDESLWANFAWTVGYKTLLDAIDQGISEMRQHKTEIPDSEKPSVLQTILNAYWRGAR